MLEAVGGNYHSMLPNEILKSQHYASWTCFKGKEPVPNFFYVQNLENKGLTEECSGSKVEMINQIFTGIPWIHNYFLCFFDITSYIPTNLLKQFIS